ncbi:MAG: hypothetical protein Q8M08_07650 [Bacteroidales bacterium]|nr:hypothetical protein [Bacteroidales bacterium]
MILCCAGSMQAQFSLSFHVTPPPPWGPAGYAQVNYYYLPDVEAYYDVQESTFIYFSGNVWVRRPALPYRYRNYDLYRGYKVVMHDYRGKTPYTHFKEHKKKYSKGYRGIPQRSIGERPGKGNHDSKKYYGNPNDKQGNGHDKGKSSGHDNDKGGSHGNDKSNKKGHGQGGGKGKKK